jgi:hypothetical protein
MEKWCTASGEKLNSIVRMILYIVWIISDCGQAGHNRLSLNRLKEVPQTSFPGDFPKETSYRLSGKNFFSSI